MPPDSQQPASPSSAAKKDGHGHHHKERIGNYVVGAEIGRGSFATVYKGYRSVSALFWSACFEVPGFDPVEEGEGETIKR
jgi:hypothetical protein